MEMGFSDTIKTVLVVHRLTPILASKKRKLDLSSDLALTSPHWKTSVFMAIVSVNVGAGIKQRQLIVACCGPGANSTGRMFVSQKTGAGASDHGRDTARLPFERLAARAPCSPGFA